jgi:hypothetical protein
MIVMGNRVAIGCSITVAKSGCLATKQRRNRELVSQWPLSTFEESELSHSRFFWSLISDELRANMYVILLFNVGLLY